MSKEQNPLLAQISEKASADLAALILEGNDDILTAIHKSQTEAQLQETKPKFQLGLKIVVDLEKSTFDCSLGWNLKKSLSVSHTINDPNQEKLPLASGEHDDTKMTISSGGKSVETTLGDMKKLNQKLAGEKH